MCELTSNGHRDVHLMDMVSFGALVEAHYRAQARVRQGDFFNTRMAFHADEKGAKKWIKQWETVPGQSAKADKDLLIRTLGGTNGRR